MIKILFFIETLTGGGAEKVLRDLVNHMDQTKFDITVQTAFPCESSKYLAPGVRYKSMYASDSKANRLRYRAEAESGLAYRLHIKDDYDIECAYLEMGATKVMASSKSKKAKKLAWVHCDLQKAVSDPKVFAEKTASWYETFDQIICVSQGVKDSFDELFRGRFPSRVLYNVIDDSQILEKAKQEPAERREMQPPVVMAVGRLSGPKNYLRLLKAHEKILQEGLVHQLWIIGEGAERAKLESYIMEHGLQRSVFLPGFRENPYAYMNCADVLVCSSSYEGFSTFITEGVILGKPIVTTDCFGMKEILGDSDYGMITENDDDAFCNGLFRMLSDGALRDQYAASASKRGLDFSAAELTKKTEQFFASILGVTI